MTDAQKLRSCIFSLTLGALFSQADPAQTLNLDELIEQESQTIEAEHRAEQTVIAVCKELKGRVIGIEGNNKALDQPDSLKGGQVMLVWKKQATVAQVVIQGADGSLLLETARRYDKKLDGHGRHNVVIHTFVAS
jgi:hypothetical protein